MKVGELGRIGRPGRAPASRSFADCRIHRLQTSLSKLLSLTAECRNDYGFFFVGRGFPASLRFSRHVPSLSRERSFSPPPGAGTCGT
jgi:hypothetical protein